MFTLDAISSVLISRSFRWRWLKIHSP